MAFGDISLTSGMRSNLLSLQGTSSLVNRTQQRLASGKKVNSALDNPTAYFAAQALSQRAGDLSTLKDGMNQAIQTVQAADSGITGIQNLIDSAKGLAQSALATSNTTTRSSYAAQFTSIMTEIDHLAADAGYNGTNLLNGDTLTVTFSSATFAITGSTASSTGLAIRAASNTWQTGADIAFAQSDLDTATNTLRDTAATLSSGLAIVQARINFTSSMVSTLQTGSDQLTLADMNEEGANMLALQTRQSLSTTALSLSSQANQSVLRLFQ